MLPLTCITFIPLLLTVIHSVRAFHFAAGTPCSGTGVCSYEYVIDGTATVVTVNGFCSPSGICAANGATCTADEQCFNYCGFTSGVCGGVGALCNSQDVTDPEGQVAITCNTPFAICSEDTEQGICVLPASSSARMRARAKGRALQADYSSKHLRQATMKRNSLLKHSPTREMSSR